MITTLKQPRISFTNPGILRKKSQIPTSQFASFPQIICRNSRLSIQKPLHISSVKGLGIGDGFFGRERKHLVKCEAYEADRSEPQPFENDSPKVPGEAARKLKIGIYFATWWALNVVFNIYNKKVLNAFPYPWLTSTLSLAMGSLIMLVSWATRIAEPPQTDFEFWKALFPVSVIFGLEFLLLLKFELGFLRLVVFSV